MRHQIITTGVLWILAAGLVGGCGRRRELTRQTWPAMGTFASLTLPAHAETDLPIYAEAARITVHDLEQRLSQFISTSDIAQLNQNAGDALVELHPDTLRLLTLALHYAHASRGAFDPTAAPLLPLWGFHGGAPRDTLPSATAIRQTLASVGYSHIVLHEEAQQAGLALPGMRLDLGAIAKGYTVDAVSDRLIELGATDFMVNLAGDMRCFGQPSRGRPWAIGVRNPFDTSEIVGVLHLADGWAVSTSGHYERFVDIDGTRYAHIVDPRTGYPVTGMAGVTVVAANATRADAMATALFVLGPEQARPILEEMDDCEALMIPDRRPLELWMTPAMQARFTPQQNWEHAVRLLK